MPPKLQQHLPSCIRFRKSSWIGYWRKDFATRNIREEICSRGQRRGRRKEQEEEENQSKESFEWYWNLQFPSSNNTIVLYRCPPISPPISPVPRYQARTFIHLESSATRALIFFHLKRRQEKRVTVRIYLMMFTRYMDGQPYSSPRTVSLGTLDDESQSHCFEGWYWLILYSRLTCSAPGFYGLVYLLVVYHFGLLQLIVLHFTWPRFTPRLLGGRLIDWRYNTCVYI